MVPASVAVTLVCGLYLAAGVSYMLSNGLHYAEPGEPSTWINPGDFVFVYIGTPLAVWLAVRAVGRLVVRRQADAHSRGRLVGQRVLMAAGNPRGPRNPAPDARTGALAHVTNPSRSRHWGPTPPKLPTRVLFDQMS